jgi:hypothetical protein
MDLLQPDPEIVVEGVVEAAKHQFEYSVDYNEHDLHTIELFCLRRCNNSS